MSKVAFVYEQWFDMDEHEDYDGYDGFSELEVVDIPGGFDPYDEDLDEDDYHNVGSVLVGFNDGDGHVLEVIDGKFEAYEVELYYPPL